MPIRKRKDPWPRPRSGPLTWARDHLRVVADTVHFVSARLGSSLLVWLLVGIALAFPAGLFLLQVNLAGMTEGWEGRPGLSVYFELGLAQAEIDATAERLANRAEVGSVVVTSQGEALEEFQTYTRLSDALELLAENPLPASLRATLTADASLADLEALARYAETAPGVSEVVVEKTWLQRVTDITLVVTRLSWLLGGLFGLGAVLVTASSVRLAIEARLAELKVLKLVGATNRQIRRPYLYFGAFYGVGGALVAAMLISFGILVVEEPLGSLLGSYGQDLELAGFDPRFLLTLLAIGGVLGVAGALIAARQRLSALEIE